VARLAVSIAQLNAERTGRFPCAGAPQMIRRGPPNGSDPTQGTHPPRPPHRVAPTNPRLPTVTSGRRQMRLPGALRAGRLCRCCLCRALRGMSAHLILVTAGRGARDSGWWAGVVVMPVQRALAYQRSGLDTPTLRCLEPRDRKSASLCQPRPDATGCRPSRLTPIIKVRGLPSSK